MTASRRIALEVLVSVDGGQRVGQALATASGLDALDARDRAFVTELVNGTTRMRRALDTLAAPFVKRQLDADVQAAVRLGTYQLRFLGTPPHAAVSGTVDAAPRRARGLVNAVLRRVSEIESVSYPSPAVEHSYPDWMWGLASSQWGDEGLAALIAMNTPERPQPRPDGFVQGQASRWVCDVVDAVAPEGGRLLDLCAAPGGKATGVGPQWSSVVAVERDEARVRTLNTTVTRFRTGTPVVRADARQLPFRPGSADLALVDAPCSGLGALGRRADARWVVGAAVVDRLAVVQKDLVQRALDAVRPGGLVVYSVCTFTHQETTGVVDALIEHGIQTLDVPGGHWRRHGRGALVLPQDHGTDAMAVFVLKRPGLSRT